MRTLSLEGYSFELISEYFNNNIVEHLTVSLSVVRDREFIEFNGINGVDYVRLIDDKLKTIDFSDIEGLIILQLQAYVYEYKFEEAVSKRMIYNMNNSIKEYYYGLIPIFTFSGPVNELYKLERGLFEILWNNNQHYILNLVIDSDLTKMILNHIIGETSIHDDKRIISFIKQYENGLLIPEEIYSYFILQSSSMSLEEKTIILLILGYIDNDSIYQDYVYNEIYNILSKLTSKQYYNNVEDYDYRLGKIISILKDQKIYKRNINFKDFYTILKYRYLY